METLRNIKLTLEYDGSRFFGFQRQKDPPTIQEALERSLTRLFGCPMKIAGAAGRTDAGVHAEAQVVNFKTDAALPLKKIQQALNAFLPKEIAVKKVEEVSPDFHARYDACWKTYRYRILNSDTRSPLLNGRVWLYPHRLNLSRMRKAARVVVGRHDFKIFQAAGSNARSSVRQIRRLKIEKQGEQIHFAVEADGFLYHMVRSLVGTLLEVGRGRLSLEDFSKILKHRRRLLAGPTVPAHGLTLQSVTY